MGVFNLNPDGVFDLIVQNAGVKDNSPFQTIFKIDH
jgi:hypothetical protein